MNEVEKKTKWSSPDVVCTDTFLYINSQRISGVETQSVTFERKRGCQLVTLTLDVGSFDDRRTPKTEDWHGDAEKARETYAWEIEQFGHPKTEGHEEHVR